MESKKLELRDYQKNAIENVATSYGVTVDVLIKDIPSDKTQIEIIKEKCAELGLNIYDVLREAKVPQTTVHNWKEDPKAFKTLRKINEAIEVLSNKAEA